MVGEQNTEGVGAFHHPAGFADGGDGITIVTIVNGFSSDLGIGLGLKNVALAGKHRFQLGIVFDDAVMHQRNALGPVGMGVAVRRLAMGRPAGVSNAAKSGQGTLAETFCQKGQTSGRFGGAKTVVGKNGNARGIIAAVFQRTESFQQNTHSLLLAGITYNTTHIQFSIQCSCRFCPERCFVPSVACGFSAFSHRGFAAGRHPPSVRYSSRLVDRPGDGCGAYGDDPPVCPPFCNIVPVGMVHIMHRIFSMPPY